MFICSVTTFLWVTFVMTINFSFHRTHNFAKSSKSYIQKFWLEEEITKIEQYRLYGWKHFVYLILNHLRFLIYFSREEIHILNSQTNINIKEIKMYMHIHSFVQQLLTVRTGTISVFGILKHGLYINFSWVLKASCICTWINISKNLIFFKSCKSKPHIQDSSSKGITHGRSSWVTH